ncbi:MAG: PEP-CTERM sorting domain-containing protein [Myxococcota bacterium]
MRRNISIRTTAARFALLFGLILGAGPALALPANFDPVFGFEDTNLGGLPTISIGAEDPFLGAGEASGGPFDVDLTGSTDVCILFGDETCRASTLGITGPYSVIVSLTVSAVNSSELTGPFTLFLSGLAGTTYAASEVAVELDPAVPAALDTTAVPGFVWNGSFTPFVRVNDTALLPDVFDYVGWTVGVGDTVTFRYDVASSPAGRGTPQLMANATNVIPEPGTALLMGLGLAGLTIAGRRVEPQAG